MRHTMQTCSTIQKKPTVHMGMQKCNSSNIYKMWKQVLGSKTMEILEIDMEKEERTEDTVEQIANTVSGNTLEFEKGE